MTEQDKINAGWSCDGCGSMQTIADIRARNPLAESCCPERKLISPRELVKREKANTELAIAVDRFIERERYNHAGGFTLNAPWYEEKLRQLKVIRRRQISKQK